MSGSTELIVVHCYSEERSCVYLSYEKMDEIWLKYGEVILIKSGRTGKESACIVLPDAIIPEEAIGINTSMRNLLYLRLGDKVTIKAAPSRWYWKNVNMQPTDDSVRLRDNVFREVL